MKSMKSMKLSVVLATRNEEENISRCLNSVRNIADEIVIVDEQSTDNTINLARLYKARIFQTPHNPIFHITKQMAIDKARGEWVLQLDADEVVSPALAQEIKYLIVSKNENIESRIFTPGKQKLFERHQRLIEERDGKLGSNTREVTAFFLPRVDIFLGRPIYHGGVYPDGVIRLFKKGKAYLPAKSVHEQMVVSGKVSWLSNDLIHYSDPTLSRYLSRALRYTKLQSQEMIKTFPNNSLGLFFRYLLFLPVFTFLNLFLRHKGFLDGFHGFLWAIFSAGHFPVAYIRYLRLAKGKQ